jgi:hypothetical protein
MLRCIDVFKAFLEGMSQKRNSVQHKVSARMHACMYDGGLPFPVNFVARVFCALALPHLSITAELLCIACA